MYCQNSENAMPERGVLVLLEIVFDGLRFLGVDCIIAEFISPAELHRFDLPVEVLRDRLVSSQYYCVIEDNGRVTPMPWISPGNGPGEY